MALCASSSCNRTVTHTLSSISDPKVSSSGAAPHGLLPLPAQPKFEGSGLRRTKSRKPVKSTKANASAREAVNEIHTLESAVTQFGEEIATTSGDILDAVDSVIEEGPAAAMGRGRRRSGATGKTNSRTSRRRALVMCLALGMVRPLGMVSGNNLQQSNDLRRTVSESIRRTASLSLQVPNPLLSQVSLATTVKQTNFLGEKEDLQKLTTLQ